MRKNYSTYLTGISTPKLKALHARTARNVNRTKVAQVK